MRPGCYENACIAYCARIEKKKRKIKQRNLCRKEKTCGHITSWHIERDALIANSNADTPTLTSWTIINLGVLCVYPFPWRQNYRSVPFITVISFLLCPHWVFLYWCTTRSSNLHIKKIKQGLIELHFSDQWGQPRPCQLIYAITFCLRREEDLHDKCVTIPFLFSCFLLSILFFFLAMLSSCTVLIMFWSEINDRHISGRDKNRNKIRAKEW